MNSFKELVKMQVEENHRDYCFKHGIEVASVCIEPTTQDIKCVVTALRRDYSRMCGIIEDLMPRHEAAQVIALIDKATYPEVTSGELMESPKGMV